MNVYMKYMDKLVKAIPMDDITFTTQLSHHGLLPHNVAAYIKSLPTPLDKADHFLKNVIKPSLDNDETYELEKLLAVLGSCGYAHVERMANKMKSDLDMESVGK